MDEGSVSAAVFTSNRFCAAPVQVARRHLTHSEARYILINAGNANAGTGERGISDALRTCQAVAERAGCEITTVLPFSTGVIGEFLPVDKILVKIPELLADLAEDNWLPAVHAIMTTDTVAKAVSRQVAIGKHRITVTGIAKGSGMIRPDMATLLSFIGTDIRATRGTLDGLLRSAVDKSFNRICVDGDTSTNDACALVATGMNACDIDQNAEHREIFSRVLDDVCLELAQAVVRDGEGATKFITIEIEEGRSRQECLMVAYAIATSPLVKTAFFAADANWGRILAAIGRSGLQDLEISRVMVQLGEVCIVDGGVRSAEYTEHAGQEVMRREEIKLRVRLGRGNSRETIWTSDLSHEYVKINAEYRS
jgi:glutamate N-acetyltransferase/amino-acid N-acetyltransferase